MTQNEKKAIAEINKLSLVKYLRILNYQPVSKSENETIFEVYLHEPAPAALAVDHNTNRFFVKKTGDGGTLADLVCCIFGIKPVELIGNIVPYYIDQLMKQEHDN